MAQAKKIGVVGATFLVAGNMMGSGVFLLPSSLAKIGTASIWVSTPPHIAMSASS